MSGRELAGRSRWLTKASCFLGARSEEAPNAQVGIGVVLTTRRRFVGNRWVSSISCVFSRADRCTHIDQHARAIHENCEFVLDTTCLRSCGNRDHAAGHSLRKEW